MEMTDNLDDKLDKQVECQALWEIKHDKGIRIPAEDVSEHGIPTVIDPNDGWK